MKKIGIVTFHRALNYGAILQCYALYKILSTKYDCEVINYYSKQMESIYYPKMSIVSLIKKIINFLMNPKRIIHNNRRVHKFNDFRKKCLKLSNKYSSSNIKNANSKYDAFISGSDQVWNPDCNCCDPIFYLSFAEKNKKFSYAASFGADRFDDKNYNYLRQNLYGFNNYSVREPEGIEILKKIGIEKGYVDCDPVFLLSKGEWASMCSLKRSNNYVLVYNMAKQKNANSFALELAKKNGLDILYVNHSGSKVVPSGMRNKDDLGPLDFLSLILNANYVVTTSFHGLAFSLIFNIPFYYELDSAEKNKNSRLLNLVSCYELQKYNITSKDISNVYDWDTINSKIKNVSSTSRKHLLNLNV